MDRRLLHRLPKLWGKTEQDDSEGINDRNATFWHHAAARVFKLSPLFSTLPLEAILPRFELEDATISDELYVTLEARLDRAAGPVERWATG